MQHCPCIDPDCRRGFRISRSNRNAAVPAGDSERLWDNDKRHEPSFRRTADDAKCLARRPRLGRDVARARSVDRNRGLHPVLPAAAAFAADAAVAGQSAHRSPLCGGHCRERCLEDARACRSPPNFSVSGKLSGLCVVEPHQGNCHAINAAFETALATFPAAEHFLMIDDDEIASPDWLERMVSTAKTTGADHCRRTGVAGFRRRAEARPAPPSGIRAGLSEKRSGAGDLWLRQLPDQARGVRTHRRARFRPALQFPRRRRHRLLLSLHAAWPALSLDGRRQHQRDRAAKPNPLRAGW